VRLGVVERLEVVTEPEAVRELDALAQARERPVGVESVEPTGDVVGALGATEDPPSGVGDDVVEPRLRHLARLDEGIDHPLPVAPRPDGPTIQEQEQEPVGLERERRQPFVALVHRRDGACIWIGAEEPPLVDTDPVEDAPAVVPEQILADTSRIVGDGVEGEIVSVGFAPGCARGGQIGAGGRGRRP
jgi:hypothetical protein